MGTQADLIERDRRYAKLRSAMANEGIDALIVAGKGHWWTGRGYIRYLTDFHMWGHDALLCLPLKEDPFMTFSSHAVAARIARRGWVTETEGDVYQAPRLAAMIKARGLDSGRIGVAGLRYILSAGNYQILREALPNVEFVDGDDLFNRVRAVKSELEIQQIDELWTLAKAAMERFVELVGPGSNQRDLAAEASKVALAGGARDILVFIGEEPGATDPPRDERLRCDDIVRYHMELCGESGHWCELTVNCAYRQPTDLELKLVESELAALAAIQQIARPGTRLSTVAATFEEVMRSEGWQLGSPTSHFDLHGQGMDTIEYPWYAAAEPWGQSQDWTLEAGMVFSYHPHRHVTPDVPWGTGINEDILITEEGALRLGKGWDHRWRVM